MSTVNARMAPAFVSPAGMVSTAQWRDVRTVVRRMDSVDSIATPCGNAAATAAGMALIAAFCSNRIAMMGAIMTKMDWWIVRILNAVRTMHVAVVNCAYPVQSQLTFFYGNNHLQLQRVSLNV